jgi:hypothetical protein
MPAGQEWARLRVEVTGGTSIVFRAITNFLVGFPHVPMPGIHFDVFNTGLLENDTNGNARFMLDF